MKNNLLTARLRVLRAIRHTAGEALPDDIYRGILQRVAGVESSTKLRRVAAVDDVIDELNRLGFGQRPRYHYAQNAKREWAFVDQAAPARQPLLKKIIMLMKGAGVEPGKQVAYVEGVARQMAGLNGLPGSAAISKPLVMCDQGELWLIVAALASHLRRHGVNPNAVEG